VDMDLTPFSYINPCGYEGLEVAQIKDYKKDITLKEVERLAIKLLEPIF
jgi:lipoyl(octanoyl) transferase